METDLLLAIFYEHQQRTRHDVFSKHDLSLTCDVCLHLKAAKKKLDEEEKEYFENEQIKKGG